MDPADEEQTTRYRRKVQKDEDFLARTAALTATLEQVVRLNSAVDVFETYFEEPDETTEYARASVASVAVFKDPLRDESVQPRSVSAVGKEGTKKNVPVAAGRKQGKERTLDYQNLVPRVSQLMKAAN